MKPSENPLGSGTGQLSFAAFCDSERHRDARQRPL